MSLSLFPVHVASYLLHQSIPFVLSHLSLHSANPPSKGTDEYDKLTPRPLSPNSLEDMSQSGRGSSGDPGPSNDWMR